MKAYLGYILQLIVLWIEYIIYYIMYYIIFIFHITKAFCEYFIYVFNLSLITTSTKATIVST